MNVKEVKAEIKKAKDKNQELNDKYRDETRCYEAQLKAHEEWTCLTDEEKADTTEPIIPPKPKEPVYAPLPDWRDQWKYGNKVRGIGNCGGTPCIDWGPAITPEEQTLIEALVTSPHKWADKIEKILDNPPTPEDLELLQRIKPLLS